MANSVAEEPEEARAGGGDGEEEEGEGSGGWEAELGSQRDVSLTAVVE